MIETPTQSPTFYHLVKAEPRLAELLLEALTTADNGQGEFFCANAVWYGYLGHPGIKPRLTRLVGWYAEQDGVLDTAEAYEVAYRTIYEALPACRGQCGCLKTS